jgi:hypothetical protein
MNERYLGCSWSGNLGATENIVLTFLIAVRSKFVHISQSFVANRPGRVKNEKWRFLNGSTSTSIFEVKSRNGGLTLKQAHQSISVMTDLLFNVAV